MTESGLARTPTRLITVLAIIAPVTLALIVVVVATDLLGPVNAVFILAPLILFHVVLIFAFGLVLRESRDHLQEEGISSKLADLNSLRKTACEPGKHNLTRKQDPSPDTPQLRCSECGLDTLTLVGLLGHELDLPRGERQRIQESLRGSQRLVGFAKDLFLIAGFAALMFAVLAFFVVPTGSLTQQLLISAGILVFLALLVEHIVLPRYSMNHSSRLNEIIEGIRSRD